MSFFDEDDEPRTTRSPRPRRAAPAGQAVADPQTLLIRRAVFLGGAVLFLILMVVALRGCLDSRAKDALRTYNDQSGSLIQSSAQLGDKVFKALSSAGDASPSQLQSTMNSYRSEADNELAQVKRLDVPGDMVGAQRYLRTVFELRRDALGFIAARVTRAKSSVADEQTRATKEIAGQMQAFLASDVLLLERVGPLIKKSLGDKGISGQRNCCAESARFMSDIAWLSQKTVAAGLGADAASTDNGSSNSNSSGNSKTIAPGRHGTGLLSVASGATTLQPGGNNKLTVSTPPIFNIKFANQGDNTEQNIKVTVRVTGDGPTIRAQKTTTQPVPKGADVTMSIQLDKAPPAGVGTVEVSIAKVPGEMVVTNNKQTYPVLFSK